ncbi:MAG: hypothetical protein C4532_17685 [Candidatus Abyssobacteria bacterium SURF_17]|uniref:Uncharacterized protein n=1 Tax=Candidatus Abyssobacteria bacterium SURF_17 TaxID=2093361 RepID=A0A419EQQ0_9BACT|nr:MAG: hypothetical protein C4532_17685 [Candidatus Abyssubacteria bacterium SURF_17]
MDRMDRDGRGLRTRNKKAETDFHHEGHGEARGTDKSEEGNHGFHGFHGFEKSANCEDTKTRRNLLTTNYTNHTNYKWKPNRRNQEPGTTSGSHGLARIRTARHSRNQKEKEEMGTANERR